MAAPAEMPTHQHREHPGSIAPLCPAPGTPRHGQPMLGAPQNASGCCSTARSERSLLSPPPGTGNRAPAPPLSVVLNGGRAAPRGRAGSFLLRPALTELPLIDDHY